ncbi:MAG: DUF4911 domain-containing protein [Candidatus Acetothermia bacterium]|jgi:hypothetical protein|nr:DUF4911 domain-containing protein [Candidatus Acetothermia bacterium]MDH7504610.1 DUF4911 domain-containing protein [Candidatus Acetothermia bacterium]
METWLVELDEGEIHFLAAILEGYDGIATLTRDYQLLEGKTYFKLLVPAGFEQEVEQLLRELRGYAAIGEVRRDLAG